MKKVSIIIPFYNNPEQLKKALNSVFKQSYNNYEVIIVDDGSAINYESDIVESYREYVSKIKYLRQSNTGPGLARQNGLLNSSGDYVQYLDSDDEILPDKLFSQVKVLERVSSAIMVYGLSQINSDKNNIHRSKHFKGNEDHVSLSAIQKRKWHTSSCLWNYDNSNVYWEDLTNGEDVLHDVNAGLLNTNTKVVFVNEIVSNVYMSNDLAHLSNASNDSSKHKKLVRDASELNQRIEEKLVKNRLINNIEFREALAERFYYEGLKFFKLGYPNEGKKMLKSSSKITSLFVKRLELILCSLLSSVGLLSLSNIHRIFRIHNIINPQKIHQRRML